MHLHLNTNWRHICPRMNAECEWYCIIIIARDRVYRDSVISERPMKTASLGSLWSHSQLAGLWKCFLARVALTGFCVVSWRDTTCACTTLLQARMPSNHVWLNFESPTSPQSFAQAPLSAQQLSLPDFLVKPHLGHTGFTIAVGLMDRSP